MHTLRVYCKIVKFKFLALIEYPGAFFGGIVAQWIVYGIDMFMLFLIVGQFGSLAGWIPMEVIFLYAVWLLSYAVGASFTYNLSVNFGQISISGTLDEAFVRPMPPLIFLLATNFNSGYISHFVLTVAALAVSISQLGISWSFFQWCWFVILIISGAAIQGCLMLICEMPAIRTRSASPTGVFFWELREFAQYPISIYPKTIQFIFTAVLPFGFVNFYPLQVLIGKREGVFSGTIIWLSPVAAVILILLTAVCWRAISRRYESAGT